VEISLPVAHPDRAPPPSEPFEALADWLTSHIGCELTARIIDR